MRPLTIGIDVDEVLAQLHAPWIKWGNARFGTDYTEFTHWDAPTDWWGKEAYEFLTPEIYREDWSTGVRAIVKPDPGGYAMVRTLRTLGYRIAFVSSCTPNSAHAKVSWLSYWRFMRPEDSFSEMSDKSQAPCDILVDDGVHNCLAFGKHRSIIVSRPHNWRNFGLTHRVHYLDEIPARIRRIARTLTNIS